MPKIDRQRLIETLIPAMVAAGAAIMEVYHQDFDVRAKGDASPVTEADERAETILLSAVEALRLDAEIVAEEQAAQGIMPERVGRRFWLIDPLDGTKEFINRRTDFTVNVALIEDRSPVLGLVFAPALGRMFIGDVGAGAYEADAMDLAVRRLIKVRAADRDALDVVASKSHRDAATDAYLGALKVRDLKSAGSSLKFCLLAAGEADVYPRFGPTMEWDTAAGHAVLAAAGGRVLNPDGTAFLYAKPGFKNGPFIALGDPALRL